MKKILTIAFILCLTLTAKMSMAQSSGDEALIGKARGAAHDCLNSAREPGYEITAQSEVTSICFVSGFLTTVTFYKTPVCHQEPCPKPIAQPVATVTFGCDGEVTSVTCL